MPIPDSGTFILYPSQQPPAPPESPPSGVSCIWTRRSELDSSSPQPQPQPQPPPALPDSPQIGFSSIRRRRRTNQSELDSSSRQPPLLIGSKSFTYKELESATNGFSGSSLVGEGGFGCVYRGFLRDHGIVAIKKHRPHTLSYGVVEFHAEVNITSRVHHRHIVSLVGYYIDHRVKARLERPLILVYEFLPNNSLQFHLHGRGTETIDWKTRMKIAVGSAKGLTYLHEGYPEYLLAGRFSEKSDVYSFGVVLFQLITGRKPRNDPEEYPGGYGLHWAIPLFSVALQNRNFEEFADARLGNEYNAEEMFRMVSCAANCVRCLAARRPRMSQVSA